MTDILTQIFLKDVHLCRTLIWPLGWAVGLLIQPPCTSQTDVRPAKPAVPQAVRALEKPGDQMLLSGVPPACRYAVLGMLQWPSRDLRVGLCAVNQAGDGTEWKWN